MEQKALVATGAERQGGRLVDTFDVAAQFNTLRCIAIVVLHVAC